jgi:hypothetical protein
LTTVPGDLFEVNDAPDERVELVVVIDDRLRVPIKVVFEVAGGDPDIVVDVFDEVILFAKVYFANFLFENPLELDLEEFSDVGGLRYF